MEGKMKPRIIDKLRTRKSWLGLLAGVATLTAITSQASAQQQKLPNIVMLMTDDTGWNDFGAYSGGGAALGHPTPNIDRIAKEGAMFTNWYGQASCTAGRASFITGRIPIRSALSIVVVPGDENAIRKETPTIAEFFNKNGYSTYFSGKWHLGDKPESYPIEHGFEEMKEFAAYYPGVYTYSDTSRYFHPWFPSYNPVFKTAYFYAVNMQEWEGVAGQPAKKVAEITYDYLAAFRHSANRLCHRLHQEARQRRQAVLHGRQLHEDAQPDQARAKVCWEVPSRRLLGCALGAR
jgi:arylsulfatase A-like enzyme